MKKILSVILLSSLVSNLTAQGFASLGNSGYNASETHNLVPTTFSNSKVQVIILASELAAVGLPNGGLITGISYFIKTDNTSATISADCYADLTSSSSFSSTTFLAAPRFQG